MASLARSLSTRVARIEKPKPLKNIIPNRHSFSDKEFLHNSEPMVELKNPDTPVRGGADDVLMLLDILSSNIQNKDYSNVLPITNSLCNRLKSYGSQLEEYYEEKLDKIFEVIRNGAHDIYIEKQSRLNLLHLVELRASQYQMSPGSLSYYATKSGIHHEVSIGEIGEGDTGLQLLGPGDVLKSSGKYSSPTRVPGKNYCKDEVVIRNSDSGKVNPGAKERLVQITGPSEDKIIYAKNLIEDTIKRNASPVREVMVACRAGSNSSINSSASDESNRLNCPSGRSSINPSAKDSSEFKYSVHVLNDVIHISSTNLNLLNEAFSLLDSSYTIVDETLDQSTQNFSPKPAQSVSQSDKEFIPPAPVQGILTQYSREFLLQCSKTKAAQMVPADMALIAAQYPAIIRQTPLVFDVIAYQKKWQETDGKIASFPALAEDYADSD